MRDADVKINVINDKGKQTKAAFLFGCLGSILLVSEKNLKYWLILLVI